MFTWLPLYKEVTNWILNTAIDNLRIATSCHVCFEKNLPVEDENGKIPLEVMDPITFLAYLKTQKP